MTRKEANMEIVRLLTNYINMYPDMRLGQALINLDVTTETKREDEDFYRHVVQYYEEPQKVLERVKKALER